MSLRRGQVAVYLAFVLVAICVLAVMNVGVFLAVRGKNRVMNAGDAAALAVAHYQGELLNGIGAMNVEHLKAALANDEEKCAEIMERQLRSCFLDPLKGIEIGSRIAKENGAPTPCDKVDLRMKAFLREHVFDIRNLYVNNPEAYPEPWEGAWLEFAAELERQIAPKLHAWPENAEFANLPQSFPLGLQDFYQAIAGRAWCWFRFNGLWLLDRDTAQLPLPDFTALDTCFNSEIYPLHVRFDPLPEVLDEEWVNIIRKVAGCTEDDIAASTLLTNATQRWAFYDHRWDAWSTYDGIAFNVDEFPIVGAVRREYDVLGCAALCRVMDGYPDLFAEDDGTVHVDWTAGAKPFGTTESLDGEDVDVVTTLRRFVVPSFERTALVPIDSVGGRDLHTADGEWMIHLSHHLPSSPHYDAQGRAGCWYCAQLKLWDQPSFRRQGQMWLRYNSSSCVRPTGSGSYRGGTAHGH